MLPERRPSRPTAARGLPTSDTSSRRCVPATSQFRFPHSLQSTGTGSGKPSNSVIEEPSESAILLKCGGTRDLRLARLVLLALEGQMAGHLGRIGDLSDISPGLLVVWNDQLVNALADDIALHTA